MSKIRISVVIPCYNVASHIEQALLSVLGQTLQPMEIICVDDSSTDNTIERIRKIQSIYPNRIQVFINAANRGATYTRNRGLAVSQGDYVQFLDADDVLLPDKLKHQANLAEKTYPRPDIIIGRFIKLGVDGQEKVYDFSSEDPWCALLDSKMGITSSILFNREKLIEVRGWADQLKSSQEYELMFRLMMTGAKVHFDQGLFVINRVREQSITQNNLAEFWKRYITLRVTIYNYLVDFNLLTKERKQTFINIIFDALRFLYAYDPKEAVRLHDVYLQKIGKPSITSSTTSRYLKLYELFGFRMTQVISRLVHGELPSSI